MNETRVCKKEKNQHIQVFVRVRPPNNSEIGKSITVVDVPSSKEVIVRERPQDKISKKFTFDKVFGPTSKQINVYNAVVSPLLEEVLAGYNCTVFAYGQTGTGKTFTMEGVGNDPSLHWESDTKAGIIPRSLSHLFDELRTLDAQEYSVRVSFLELYNEELFDLLSPNDDASKIRLYEDASKKGSVIIHGLEEVTVHNKSEVYKILEKGSEKRQTAATLMNAHSSRSHTVFSITVHIKENMVDGEELLKTGKLNLVDLAGSENVGRSGAVDRRAREAGNINQSLLTLGRVITALVERAPHIPYRESKLTRLLQESLGGRTKTSIIATVSPASINLEETLSTLDYAHRAKNITNRPELNQKLSKKALLKEYTEEIERLRRDLLATRERNGVYLAQENYNDMQAQIDCQEKDIADKINHIKALQEDMQKKSDLFEELQTDFQIHLHKFNETQAILQDTEEVLKETEVQLLQTKRERDEHKHLVDKHMTTEKILTSQARQLLGVAEMASKDTHKLHEKIHRKNKVEQENTTLAHQFQADMTNRVNEIEKDFTAYTQDLVQFCLSMKNDVGLQMATQSQSIDTTIRHISKDLVSKQSSVTKNLIGDANCTFDKYETWINDHLEHITTTSDHETKLLNEISLILAPKIEELVKNNVRQNLEVLRDDVLQKLEQMYTYVATSTHKICNSLSASKDRLLQNITILKQDAETIQERRNAILKNKQVFAQAFENLRDQFIVLNNLDEENQADIDNICTEIHRTTDCIREEVTACCDGNIDSERTHDKQMKEQISTVKCQFQDGVDKNIAIANASVTAAENLREQLQTSIGDRCNAWKSHRETIQVNVTKMQETAELHKQQILATAQVVQKIVVDASVNHEEYMEDQKNKATKATLELQHKLEAQGIEATQWRDGVTAKLRTTHHQVEKFLAEDLRHDVPTGSTPVRKDYQYPRQLAATSPHERIIERFRATMNEVIADNEFQNDNKENDDEDNMKSGNMQGKQIIAKLKPLNRRVLGSSN